MASRGVLGVSVVIPTFNERENIARLVRRLHPVLEGRAHEIIVVDDGSPDGTGQVVESLAREIPALRLSSRKGKSGIGSALRWGYGLGRMDILLSMDADLSFDPADAARLIEAIEEGCDLVLGCRHAQGSFYETPHWRILLKYLVSREGNRVVRVATGLPLHDFSGNFRAIRREAWSRLRLHDDSNSFLLEMILKAHCAGLQIKEVPVTFKDRLHGESKLNLFLEAPKFLAKLLPYAVRFRFCRKRPDFFLR